MKVHRYSQWDGTQEQLQLDAGDALDAVSDVMLHGLSAQEALQYMQRSGFPLAGQDFRVMGTQELTRDLRKQAHELYDRHSLEDPFAQQRQRWEELQALEEKTLRAHHGYESQAMNDFLERRHASSRSFSEALERFADYEFRDAQAQEAYDELREELAQARALEEFMAEQGMRFRGRERADYPTAQRVRQQIRSLEAMTQAIEAGNFAELDPRQLGELLGEAAARSIMILRDLPERLRSEGYLGGTPEASELTPKAVRRIGQRALADVFTMLQRGRGGEHATSERGSAGVRPDETRPYEFGDALDVDVTKTVLNALRRGARGEPGGPGRRARGLALDASDLEVREHDFSTETTTVLLLDLSWSMSFEGRFPAAKRVALAMDHLIRTRFPRDRFFVVGFSTRARQLSIDELPSVSWDPSDPFTNLQEGLQVAERLIAANPSRNPQVLVITDGQPTAYFVGEELHVEWPSGYGGISPSAVAQTLKQVHRITRRGVVINTFMLHDSPELVGFVERMTEINRGRALFTDPSQLGSYVMVDHMSQRRRARGRA